MAIQASARLTFHQIVDGTTLNFTLSTSQGLTQIKSKDPISYHPNYTATPNVITPFLAIPGSTANQVKGACTWYANGTKITSGQGGYVVRSTGDFGLEIKQNLSSAILRIRCEYNYVDPTTALSTKVSAETTLNQTENAGTLIMAAIRPMTTEVFKKVGSTVPELQFEATMVRGGAADTTDVAYEWHILGTNGQFHKITAGSAPAGSGLPAGTLFKNVTSRVITVSADAVKSVSTLKVVCKDTDRNSSTYNKTAEAYQSLVDLTDPYQVIAYAKEGTNISKSDTVGKPVELSIMQGTEVWKETEYNGKMFGFYRVSAAGEQDATFNPPQADFAGWTVASNRVTRTYSTTAPATAANRTIRIKNEHLHTKAAAGTSFDFFIDW